MSYIDRTNREFPDSFVKIFPEVKGIYSKGRWDKAIFDKCVAIVGSRRMTNYGRQVVSQIVPQLASQGYTTVSGYMYGIDIEVHRSTYLSGGRTIAVLGWGIDYKSDIENDDLHYKLIDSDSLFISEYGGKMSPKRGTFVARNRIVAGLASEVIVVEGAKVSGSMITANLAYEMGKKLYAVPGPINSAVSVGTNELIKQGKAEMLTLDDMNIYSGKGPINRHNEHLEINERKIIEHIKRHGASSMGEISKSVGLSVGETGVRLTKMEMKGVIEEKGGRFYLSVILHEST